MRIFAIGLCLITIACAGNPQITDPATKRAITADQVVVGANALEKFVIDENHSGALNDKISIRIVKAVIDIDTAAKGAPAGWQPAVVTFWAGLKNDLDKEPLPTRTREAVQLFENLVVILQGVTQ